MDGGTLPRDRPCAGPLRDRRCPGYDVAPVPLLVLLIAILAIGGYAAFSRLLAHREKMAELEARRPHVILQLPPGELGDADRLTEDILVACREKGIEVDLEVTDRS